MHFLRKAYGECQESDSHIKVEEYNLITNRIPKNKYYIYHLRMFATARHTRKEKEANEHPLAVGVHAVVLIFDVMITGWQVPS